MKTPTRPFIRILSLLICLGALGSLMPESSVHTLSTSGLLARTAAAAPPADPESGYSPRMGDVAFAAKVSAMFQLGRRYEFVAGQIDQQIALQNPADPASILPKLKAAKTLFAAKLAQTVDTFKKYQGKSQTAQDLIESEVKGVKPASNCDGLLAPANTVGAVLNPNTQLMMANRQVELVNLVGVKIELLKALTTAYLKEADRTAIAGDPELIFLQAEKAEMGELQKDLVYMRANTPTDLATIALTTERIRVGQAIIAGLSDIQPMVARGSSASLLIELKTVTDQDQVRSLAAIQDQNTLTACLNGAGRPAGQPTAPRALPVPGAAVTNGPDTATPTGAGAAR